jgi:hypothetical protein
MHQNRLHMRGIYLDTISEITDEIQPYASAESLLNLIRLAFYQDQFLTGHTRLESLMRMICADIVEARKTVNGDCSRDDIFEWFAKWFRLVSHNPRDLARFRESLKKVDSQDCTNSGYSALTFSAKSPSFHRRPANKIHFPRWQRAGEIALRLLNS